MDDYKYDARAPVVTTTAMAEGAIEGAAADYALRPAPPAGGADARFATAFKYARFDRAPRDRCATRNVSALTGRKRPAETAAKAAKGRPPPVVGNRDDDGGAVDAALRARARV